MKSIRLSLVVYFLLLLAGAMGAMSLYAYQTTRRGLLERKATVERLLKEQHRDRKAEVSHKVDRELFRQAMRLAREANYQFNWDNGRWQYIYPVGLLSAGLSPNGHLLLPVWVAEGVPTALSMQIHSRSVVEIQFNEEVLHDADDDGTEYFQINSVWGNTWRSHSLGERSFPVDPKVFFPSKDFYDWTLEDTTLEPGVNVRRVSVKVPVTRVTYKRSNAPPFSPLSSPPQRQDQSRRSDKNDKSGGSPKQAGPPRPVNPFPPPSESWERPTRAFFIQCASETKKRDAALADLEQNLTTELADLEAESERTLAALGSRLLGISLGTFAALVVGGLLLVRLGLSPLDRLSDAVSRVSERDFRLQFAEPSVPSELRPIVERLRQTLDLLQRAFEREKQAAADISHELRTPLAALLTTIEVGLRKPRKPEEYRELLQDCHASGQQMNVLVERLLALARLDAGVDVLRTQEVDVAEIAEQCAALVRPLAEARDLTLSVRCDGPAILQADPNKLREVVTNLLHNAIEYNRPQGRVDLTVGRENGSLQVEVRDTGIGIAPAARAHLFERFFRADPSRHSEGMHAGLGLAIVKGYVDLMGGTIDVESAEGEGSTFRVTLPAHSPACPSEPARTLART